MTYITTKTVLGTFPGGFAADWAMDYRSDDGETVVTNGPDWADGIPDGDEWDSARESADEYSTEVAAAIEKAVEFEQEAKTALENDDYEAARSALESAAAQERQFGDDPSYSRALRLMGELTIFNVYHDAGSGCDEAIEYICPVRVFGCDND